MTKYERYCKLRDAKKLKDSNVAALTGIGKSTFSDWKSGRSELKNDKLQKIADCLGVSVGYFTDDESDDRSVGYYINDETAPAPTGAALHKLYRPGGRHNLLAKELYHNPPGPTSPIFFQGSGRITQSLIII